MLKVGIKLLIFLFCACIALINTKIYESIAAIAAQHFVALMAESIRQSFAPINKERKWATKTTLHGQLLTNPTHTQSHIYVWMGQELGIFQQWRGIMANANLQWIAILCTIVEWKASWMWCQHLIPIALACGGMLQQHHHSTNQASRWTIEQQKNGRECERHIQFIRLCFVLSGNREYEGTTVIGKYARITAIDGDDGETGWCLIFACFGKHEICSGTFEQYFRNVRYVFSIGLASGWIEIKESVACEFVWNCAKIKQKSWPNNWATEI